MRARAAQAAFVGMALVTGGCEWGGGFLSRQRSAIEALERERDGLRQRLDALHAGDKSNEGMPEKPLRVGLPTPLVRSLVQRVTAGFVDVVTVELTNIRVHKEGTIKKVVTLGQYELDVLVNQIKGRLKPGTPDVQFGGNQVNVTLPVTLASGTARATINFKWKSSQVAGMVCGDLDIIREVVGVVRPEQYPVAGSLTLSASAGRILASPHFPPLNVNLKVEASAESWAAVKAVLDEQEGVCGFVVDKVDILGTVRELVDKGFDVRLPTEKLGPMAIPVAVEPTVTIHGTPVTLGVKLDELAITESMIWLGADVHLETPGESK